MHSRCLCGRSISNGTHGAFRLCTSRSAHVEEPPHKKVAPVLKKYGVTQVPPDFCRICYYLCNYLVFIYSNQPIRASFIQTQLVTQLVTFSVRLSTGRLQADGWGWQSWLKGETKQESCWVLKTWNSRWVSFSAYTCICRYVHMYRIPRKTETWHPTNIVIHYISILY